VQLICLSGEWFTDGFDYHHCLSTADYILSDSCNGDLSLWYGVLSMHSALGRLTDRAPEQMRLKNLSRLQDY
jgi:hypothetical protein